MKKSALSLAALVLISASSMTASAQSPTAGPDTVGGCIPRPQTVGGTIPRPQGIFNGIYSAVIAFFGF